MIDEDCTEIESEPLFHADLQRRGEEADMKELLAAYEDEVSAYWLNTHALLAFRDRHGDNELAFTLGKDAWPTNQYVLLSWPVPSRPPSTTANILPLAARTRQFTMSMNSDRLGTAHFALLSG